MFFLTIWRHLVAFGSHLGAYWILKGSLDRQFSHKVNIQLEAGRCIGKTLFWDRFLMSKWEALIKPQQAFHNILVAKYEFLGIVKCREK